MGVTILGCRPAMLADESPMERVETGLLPRLPIAGQSGWKLEERMRHHGVPGVSLAVIDGFEIVWARGYGVADLETGARVTPKTLFQAASISKTVTASAAMVLGQQGLISLDTPINDLLTTWQLPEGGLGDGSAGVTLRRLLGHTAGLGVFGFDGYIRGEPVPTVSQLLDGLPPSNSQAVRVMAPPGEQASYSGGGYVVAQQALADALGLPFPDLMRQTLFEPLGMRDSLYPPEERQRRDLALAYYAPDHPVPGGYRLYVGMGPTSLWSTATDLARLGLELARAARGKGQVLGRDAVGAMSTARFDDVGLGLYLVERAEGHVYWENSGDNRGYRAFLSIHPELGHGLAVMTNGSQGGALIGEIRRAVERVYGWPSAREDAIPAAAGLASTADFSGRFLLHPDLVLEVAFHEGGARARDIPGRGWSGLTQLTDGSFIDSESGRRLTFELDPEGRVASLEVQFYSGRTEVFEPLPEADIQPIEHLAAGRIEEGLESYRAIEDLGAGRLESVAWQLLETHFDAAAAVFELALEREPLSLRSYFELAELYGFGRRTTQVRETYLRLLAVLPKAPNADPVQVARLRSRAELWIERLAETPPPADVEASGKRSD